MHNGRDQRAEKQLFIAEDPHALIEKDHRKGFVPIARLLFLEILPDVLRTAEQMTASVTCVDYLERERKHRGLLRFIEVIACQCREAIFWKGWLRNACSIHSTLLVL